MTTPTAAHGARLVGQSMKRVEDPRLLSGHGRYVDDLQIRGLLHVAFLRSTAARGTVTHLDVSPALALEGVVAVYTAKEINPLAREMWVSPFGPPPPIGTMPYPPLKPLADEDVRFAGDPIAMVIATDRYIAEDGVDLIEVEIDPLPAVSGYDRAREADAPLVHKERDSNVSGTLPAADDPELDDILRNAPHTITRTFRQARATNVPMETRGLICDYDPFSGDFHLLVSSQGPHEYRAFCSRLLGIPESRIRVSQQDVGGGFGRKIYVTRDEAAVMIAGFLTQKPIKWIEDRRENLMTANQCREQEATVTAAFDDSGTILGLSVHQIEDVGAFPTFGMGRAASMSAMVVTGPYKIPKARYTCDSLFSNTVPKAPYRGPWMMETTVREQLVDHIPRELGIDPVEIRRRNVITQSDLPFVMPSQLPIDQLSADQTLEQAVEMVDYAGFRTMQAEARAAGRYLGLGLSLFVEPSAVGFGLTASEGATLRISANGDVDVFLGSGNHGQSVETTIAQVTADELGVPFESVTIHQGDTQGTAHGNGTGGSRTAVFCGGAAAKGAQLLREKVLRIAASLLEAAPEDLEMANAVVSVRGTPTKAVPLAQVSMLAYMGPEMLPAGEEAGLETTVRFATDSQIPFTWSNACHICVVEIDVETGLTKILRYIVSEDCGVMINPMVVEGQIAGGVVQGIGGVLYEHLVYDDDGNPLTTSFMDYLIPTACEVPILEIGHIEVPATDNPGGFKGLGEGGAICSPAAVANAVADALAPLGVVPTRFPFSPSYLLDLIDEGPRNAS